MAIPKWAQQHMQQKINEGNLDYNDLGENARNLLKKPPSAPAPTPSLPGDMGAPRATKKLFPTIGVADLVKAYSQQEAAKPSLIPVPAKNSPVNLPKAEEYISGGTIGPRGTNAQDVIRDLGAALKAGSYNTLARSLFEKLVPSNDAGGILEEQAQAAKNYQPQTLAEKAAYTGGNLLTDMPIYVLGAETLGAPIAAGVTRSLPTVERALPASKAGRLSPDALLGAREAGLIGRATGAYATGAAMGGTQGALNNETPEQIIQRANKEGLTWSGGELGVAALGGAARLLRANPELSKIKNLDLTSPGGQTRALTKAEEEAFKTGMDIGERLDSKKPSYTSSVPDYEINNARSLESGGNYVGRTDFLPPVTNRSGGQVSTIPTLGGRGVRSGAETLPSELPVSPNLRGRMIDGQFIPYAKAEGKGSYSTQLPGLKSKDVPASTKEIPLPPGISPASLKLPSTIETITSKTERGPLDVRRLIRSAYQKTVDSSNRLNDVDNYVMKTTGKKLAPQDRAYMLALNQRGADQTARYILEEGMVDAKGNISGPSFKEVVQKVPSGKWRKFEDYLKLNHYKAWEKNGLEVYDKNLNMNEILADKKIAQYEQVYPWMKQAAQDYTGWINQFGEKWLVETGMVSPQQWQAMRAEYKDYIPFQRLMEEVEQGLSGAKAGFANQPNPIKRAGGSGRKTIESIETMIERVPAYVKAAKRNEIMVKLIDRIKADPQGMATWGEIVTPDTAHLTMPNVLTGRVNGERIHVKISDPQLLESLTTLTPEGQNIVIEFVRQGTRIMKMLTTGINPVFSLGRNIFRDLPMSYVASKSTNNPITWVRDLTGAFVDILGNRDIYKSYKAMGGGHSSSAAADRNLLAESKARILPGYIDPKKPVQATGRLAKKGFNVLERLANVTETLPRLGEYRRTTRQDGGSYESRVRGLFEANDVTVNFKRTGEVTRGADAFIPYLNAAVQGLDKFGRMFKDNPIQATSKAIAAITIPSIVMYAVNHDNPDYNRLADWVKDNNFLIPKGDGTFIKIPKPRETGVIFGAAVERALRQWRDNDSNAFEKFAETVKTNFIPPTRTIAAPFGDVRANKDFTGRAIVPGYMENLSPRLQYDERTSSPAKIIGEKLNISPKQVDYIVRSYTGILGSLGIPALSEGATVKETLVRQVTADPVYSNDVVNEFYEKKKEFDTKATDTKYTGGVAEPQEERFRKLYGKISDTISDTRDQMKAIEKNQALTPEAKKEILRGMQAAIVTMAEIANKSEQEQMKLYSELKRKGKIVEQKPISQTKKAANQRKEQKSYNEMVNVLMR